MTLIEQTGNTLLGQDSLKESCLVRAQALIDDMRAAANDPTQSAKGFDAREAFLGMQTELSEILRGPQATEVVTMLQTVITADLDYTSPAEELSDRLSEEHIQKAGIEMTLSGIGDGLVVCAKNTADTQLAEAATTLLYVASAFSPEQTSLATHQLLANKLPGLIRTAVAKTANDPRTQECNIYDETTDTENLGVYHPSLSYITDHAYRIAGHTAPEDRAAIFDVFNEAAAKAADNPYWAEVSRELFLNMGALDTFEKLTGLPAEKLRDAWCIGYGKRNTTDNTRMNEIVYEQECLKRIVSLEVQYPGICLDIYRRFGIRNFARYSEKLLIRQYLSANQPALSQSDEIPPIKEHGQQQRMYFLSGTDDNNGSSIYNSGPKIEKAMEELESLGVLTTLVEVNTRLELKVRARMARMAGWVAANAAFVDAHGDYGTVTLGAETVDMRDIDGWLGALVAGTIAPDGTVIINTCRGATGEENLAKELHYASGRTITGSRAGTWLKALRVYTDEAGKVHLASDIKYSKKWEGTEGEPTATYGTVHTDNRSVSANGNSNSSPETTQSMQYVQAKIYEALSLMPCDTLEEIGSALNECIQKIEPIANGSRAETLQMALDGLNTTNERVYRIIEKLCIARSSFYQYLSNTGNQRP